MLTKNLRKLAPQDGTWFRTQAQLASILRYTDPDVTPADLTARLWLPTWVKLVPHIGQATRTNPEARYYHATVRLADDPDHQEIEGVSPYAAGLCRDSELYGWENDNAWIYAPHGYDHGEEAPGEDASYYACGQCGETCYRDEDEDRYSKSAVLRDGALVCRNCTQTGLVARKEVRERFDRCRALAAHVGGDCLVRLDRNIAHLAMTHYWEAPAQTRVFNEDEWSFNWCVYVVGDGGKPRFAMNGGLIYFGPRTVLQADGSYTFTNWDHKTNAVRPATAREIQDASWSIHT